MQWGQAATSEDFQKAFAGLGRDNPGTGKKGGGATRKSSASSLDNLFDLWVYGIPSGNAK